MSGRVAMVILAGLWLGLGFSQVPAGKPESKPDGSTKRPPAIPFTGIDSCSGRACHGALEAGRGPGILGNEFTIWATRDPHADAYRTLFKPESKAIQNNLKSSKPAFEDPVCLACHTVPQGMATTNHPLLETGISCDACHGNATNWLALHTSSKWQGSSAKEKLQLGMLPTGDPMHLAQTCSGCHVGAPPDPAKGLPAREVNHDLLAAGHPWLNFEFTSFLANIPKHWRDTKTNQRLSNGSETWALGQAASAEAAMLLLAHRAADPKAPWPELAEFQCFACHHDLQNPGWHQIPTHLKDRRPGSPPWANWYTFAPQAMARQKPSEDSALLDSLTTLTRNMNKAAKRETIRTDAKAAGDILKSWTQRLKDQSDRLDQDYLRKFLQAIPENKNQWESLTWDEAAQIYLASANLSGETKDQQKALGQLADILAFPKDYRSPRDFRSRDHWLNDFQALLESFLKKN